jgi:prepilin-type processing-associated H-X9-DG protein
MNDRRRGLRLFELMAIIAGIALVLAVLAPVVAQARDAARRSQCTNNLKQFALALHNYVSANNDTFPPLYIDDPLDGSLYQSHSLHMRLLPYLESHTVYNHINWDVPARWGPSMSPNYDDSAGGGLWGAIQSTVATTHIKSFLCPSDPNPENSGTLGWKGQTRQVGWNSYPYNIGLNRHINNWRMNGPGYVASTWDGTLKRSVSLMDFVDGTNNTAVFSEWVKGSGVGLGSGTDVLSMVYQAGVASDAFTGHLYADWLLAQACQKNGLTRDWDWKGEWWIDGTRNGYSHTQTPNRRACNYDDIGLDRRGTITLIGASSLHPGGVNVAFMDGSVRFVKNSTNFVTWYAIATPNGNEVTPQEDIAE